MSKTYYSLGFAFSMDLSNVLLIEKTRPDWQKGKLNGLGGKIDRGENGEHAIVREVFEESGLQTKPDDWKLLTVLKFPVAIVFVYCCRMDISTARTKTDEKVTVFSLKEISCLITIPNAQWLIPLAKWHLEGHAWPGENFEYSKERM